MKTFSQFMTESFYAPVVSVNFFSSDFKTRAIEEVNRALTQCTAEGFASPCDALQVVSKAMAQYGIILPQVLHLKEPLGEEVFAIKQGPTFGSSAGSINSPENQYEEKPFFYLYFSYNMTEKGVYEAFAVVADEKGLNDILKADNS